MEYVPTDHAGIWISDSVSHLMSVFLVSLYFWWRRQIVEFFSIGEKREAELGLEYSYVMNRCASVRICS